MDVPQIDDPMSSLAKGHFDYFQFLVIMSKAAMLGTILPGFKSCKPPWLRLSEGPWDHKPLSRQSLSSL